MRSARNGFGALGELNSPSCALPILMDVTPFFGEIIRCEREDQLRRRRFLSVLGGAALAPLAPLPVCADPPDGCSVPAAREDGWPVASVNEDKLIDRDALCRMVD